jgi:hypothetical protein
VNMASVCDKQGEAAQSPAIERARFLKSLNAAARAGKLQAALVSVYGRIGDLLSEGHIEECNELLACVETETTDIDLLLSFLMATATEEKALPARKTLYDRARTRFVRELGETETKELLANLA